MSSKRTLLASSLALCTTSASWLAGTDQHPVYAEELNSKADVDPEQKQLAQEAIYQYLSPIAAVAEGETSAKVETKPLRYRVEKGDTLYGIGQRFGIPYEEIAAFNRLSNPHQLNVGQELRLPLSRKWIRLRFGDTVESLAKAHKTTPDFILYLNPVLKDAGFSYVGQRVAVPQKLEVKTPSNTWRSIGQWVKQKKKNRMKLATKPVEGSFVFRWPVSGQITSNFGWRGGRQHKGIDIWSSAKSRALIHSSLSGVVIQAGYSGAYGNLVVVDHGGGWVTYYAHLSRISVSKGEQVSTGQVLGNMGRTGNATGYHLHFEVRKNGKAINPLLVLR